MGWEFTKAWSVHQFILSGSMTTGSPFYPLVSPSLHGVLASLLLGIGVFFTFCFFAYESTTDNSSQNIKKHKNIVKEIVLASISSVFLGSGSLFLLLWAGVYV